MRRKVVHALRKQIIRRMNRRRGKDKLQLCQNPDIPPLLLPQPLNQPLHQILRPLTPRRLHPFHPLLYHGAKQLPPDGEVPADLPQLGDEVLREGPEPGREVLQLDDGEEDVRGEVDAGGHPLLVAVQGGADEGATGHAGYGAEGEGLELDGDPVWEC